MNIQYDDLIKACEKGDTNTFQQLFAKLTNEQKPEFLTYKDYAAYHFAMASGNAELLEIVSIAIIRAFAQDLMEPEEVLVPAFQARDGEGFRHALDDEHLAVIEALLFEIFLDYYCEKIINEKKEYMAYVLEQDSLKPAIADLFNLACATNLDTVKNWVDILPNEMFISLCSFKSTSLLYDETSFLSCFYYVQDPEILDYLWQNLPFNIKEEIALKELPGSLIHYVKYEKTEIIRKMMSLLDNKQQAHVVQFEDYNCFVYAADRGNLEIIKILWDIFTPEAKVEALKASNYAAYRLANKANHLEVVSFLESVAQPDILAAMQKAVSQPVK